MKPEIRNMMPFLIIVATAAGLIAAAAGSVAARMGDSNDNGLKDFAAFVEKTRRAYQVPGAAVGIVRDDRVVFLMGFGVVDIERQRNVDENTRFQVASNTKFMTAAAIGVLVDRGLVEWDAPVINYVSDFQMPNQEATNAVSFRDLLSHQAGFKAYEGGLLGRLGYSYAEMLYRIRFMELAGFRDKSRYSNIGFFAAGEIAARATGLPDWERQIIWDILEPLNLTRTSPYHESLYKDGNYAAAHRLGDNGVETMDQETDPLPPAGQIVSTAADMCQWMRMLLNKGELDGRIILTPDTVAELFASSIANDDGGPLKEQGSANGLGCNSYTFLGRRVVEKNGALDGVRSVVTLIPELNTGIVVLANLNLTVFPEAIRTQFLENSIGRSGQDLQAYYRDEVQPRWSRLAARPQLPAKPEPSPIPLENLAGTYVNRFYGTFAVENRQGELALTSRTPTPYTARMPHWEGLEYLVVWPIPDDGFGLIAFSEDSSQPERADGFDDQPHIEGYFMNDYGRFDRQ